MPKYIFKTTPERSKLMSKIRGKNTKPEIKFRKALWAHGIRYRINVAELPGKPDIVIGKIKVVIFIDGGFWHGYKWEDKKPKIEANREYWINKIERNMKRDQENRKELEGLGFTVFRFWGHEVNGNLSQCINIILKAINDALEN